MRRVLAIAFTKPETATSVRIFTRPLERDTMVRSVSSDWKAPLHVLRSHHIVSCESYGSFWHVGQMYWVVAPVLIFFAAVPQRGHVAPSW